MATKEVKEEEEEEEEEYSLWCTFDFPNGSAFAYAFHKRHPKEEEEAAAAAIRSVKSPWMSQSRSSSWHPIKRLHWAWSIQSTIERSFISLIPTWLLSFLWLFIEMVRSLGFVVLLRPFENAIHSIHCYGACQLDIVRFQVCWITQPIVSKQMDCFPNCKDSLQVTLTFN